MQEFRKCRSLICKNQQQSTQERIAERYANQYSQRIKQNRQEHTTIIFGHPLNANKKFSFGLKNEKPILSYIKEKDVGTQKCSISIKELKGGFDNKNIEDFSIRHGQNKMELVSQIRTYLSPQPFATTTRYEKYSLIAESKPSTKKISMKTIIPKQIVSNQSKIRIYEDKSSIRMKTSLENTECQTKQSEVILRNRQQLNETTQGSLSHVRRMVYFQRPWNAESKTHGFERKQQREKVNIECNSKNIPTVNFYKNKLNRVASVQVLGKDIQIVSPTPNYIFSTVQPINGIQMHIQKRTSIRTPLLGTPIPTLIDFLNDETHINSSQLIKNGADQLYQSPFKNRSNSIQLDVRPLICDSSRKQNMYIQAPLANFLNSKSNEKESNKIPRFNLNNNKGVITMESINSQKQVQSYLDVHYMKNLGKTVTKLI